MISLITKRCRISTKEAQVLGHLELRKDHENEAEATKGKKAAEAGQRIFVQQREAEAIAGENESKAKSAESNAELASRQAHATQLGEVARREAKEAIEKAQYGAELSRLTADEVVGKEIERKKIEIEGSEECPG